MGIIVSEINIKNDTNYIIFYVIGLIDRLTAQMKVWPNIKNYYQVIYIFLVARSVVFVDIKTHCSSK